LSEQNRIHVGAHLHDIGKIGIPDAILDKPGRLNPQEMEMIKLHPVIGDQIIGKTRLFQSVADIVRHHHERYDGKGYPDGLRGDEIPLGARVVAVADAFDAMTSPRPYRPALDRAVAINELVRCCNSQFDSELVEVFVKLVEDGAQLQLVCPNSDKMNCCSVFRDCCTESRNTE
jgi:HD-GYP domain-containing protein (c-di-GMP phosphodiesterase class II)